MAASSDSCDVGSDEADTDEDAELDAEDDDCEEKEKGDGDELAVSGSVPSLGPLSMTNFVLHNEKNKRSLNCVFFSLQSVSS